jgi:hypothetical protein
VQNTQVQRDDHADKSQINPDLNVEFKSQTEKNKFCMIPFVSHLKTGKT